MPCLGFTEVVLMHWNSTDSNYEQDSRIFSTFFPNKSFGQLLDISPEKLYYHKLIIFIY